MVAPAPPVPIREIFRRFWPYARPYRRWLLLTLVFIVLTPLIDVATLWLFKLVVDDVMVPRDLGPLPWLAAAYFGLTVVGGLVGFADQVLSSWVGQRFVLDMRTSFFRHLQSMSLDFFERRRLGDVLSRLSGDIGAIENFVLSGVADALAYTARIAFFGAALFLIQWQLALASLVVAPLCWYAARSFSGLIKRASRERRRRSGTIMTVAEETLANAPLVQAYNRQETEVERFQKESLAAFAAGMASTRVKALFTPLIDLIELSGALTVMALGTVFLARGDLTVGGLLVFIAYLTQLYGPIRGLSGLSNTIFSASAGAERVIEVLEQQPSVKDPERPRRLTAARGGVEFDAVSFAYPGTDATALGDLSFSARPGETIALVGQSGAGKTTAAKLLLRFYDPTAGAVRLDGVDLRELALRDLRDNTALLLQETLVFEGTIRDNIAYGRPGASDAEVEAAARAADAHEFVTALPEGYDALIGERGRRLSGGQKQRVAIARAMIRDAPLLILDEPTTGLDAEAGRRVIEPLRRLARDRTTVLISHNLLTVSEADEILFLDRGRLTERGTHSDLLALGGGYAQLWAIHRAGQLEVAA